MFNRVSMRCLFVGLCLSAAASVAETPATWAYGEQTTDSTLVIVVGNQQIDLDGKGRRGTKFEDMYEHPRDIFLESLRWSDESTDRRRFFQATGGDLFQSDDHFMLRGGFEPGFRFRFDRARTPRRFADGAVTPLGRVAGSEYRIADFVQRFLEDPDGDGIPFHNSDDASDGQLDNVVVGAFVRDFLAGQSSVSLGVQHEANRVSASYAPVKDVRFTVQAARQTRDGLRPLATGTYQRITSGDDYRFSVRGVELLKPVDHATTTVDVGANVRQARWFAKLGYSYSRYENQFAGITYDNPFWFNDTIATTGSRRGLWREGRMALEPSNDAHTVSLTGGLVLPKSTQFTATASVGEHRQDEPFLPLTTNPALIGRVDLNGDGSVNAADDPTVVGTLPKASLDGKTRLTALTVTATSRPVNRLALTGRYRFYDHDARHESILFPYRGYYVESDLNAAFQGTSVLAWPLDHRRDAFSLEAVARVHDDASVAVFGELKKVDRDRYFDANADNAKDGGTRAVSENDEKVFGGTVMVTPSDWFDGRVTYRRASQEFSGAYRPAYGGEQQELRQFDIAERDRDAVDAAVNLTPNDRVSFGIGGRYAKDDYPASAYGLRESQQAGVTVDASYRVGGRATVFAYADVEKADGDMRLATKCSGCPSSGGDAWGVPGYTWNTNYEDRTTAVGGGADVALVPNKYRLMVQANYLRGKISQKSANEGTPPAQVGTAEDFPDQITQLVTGQAQVLRRVTSRYSLGVAYRFEDYDLEDFQWDVLEPYGADFLEIDEAARYLFLNSRYGDYRAHAGSVFVKLNF